MFTKQQPVRIRTDIATQAKFKGLREFLRLPISEILEVIDVQAAQEDPRVINQVAYHNIYFVTVRLPCGDTQTLHSSYLQSVEKTSLN